MIAHLALELRTKFIWNSSNVRAGVTLERF
jgi:hypothetical protein